jgi:uncharacterized protein
MRARNEETAMTISMYQASVPVFIRVLGNLKAIVEKAALHAAERKIDESAFLNARLFPDMLTFTRQVQIATDFARGTGARLAGFEPPSFEDKEQTFAELVTRLERNIAFLKTLTAAQIDGSEGREIVRPIRGEPKKFNGQDYLLLYALPNFYFHTTTAYAILRHNGVAIGKGDFIGSLG